MSYKKYCVLYDSCSGKNAAKTDNQVFLPLNARVYDERASLRVYKVYDSPIGGVISPTGIERPDDTNEWRYDDNNVNRDDLNSFTDIVPQPRTITEAFRRPIKESYRDRDARGTVHCSSCTMKTAPLRENFSSNAIPVGLRTPAQLTPNVGVGSPLPPSNALAREIVSPSAKAWRSQETKSLPGTCGGSCSGGDDNLFPLLDPRFNLREVAKQMILLEDHLFQKKRRCEDCISKHFMTAEGFLDEAITLDKKKEYVTLIVDLQQRLREVLILYKNKRSKITDNDYNDIAQRLRDIRKPLCQKYACFV